MRTTLRRSHFHQLRSARLAQEIQAKLRLRTMRVVGDPRLAVRRAVTSWGYIGAGIPLISREGVDVLICGETREWELVEYVQDMISCGKNKALIVLGHVVSEQAGMKLCAEWLRPLVPEVEWSLSRRPNHSGVRRMRCDCG